MFAKLNTLAILAAASATFSVAAVAAPVVVDVRVAPPPARYEMVPASRPGYAWVPGYWDWRGHRHVWVTGHWERARPGYSHRPSVWVHEGDRWTLQRGGWTRADRDRDGIPNRYDRDRDGDRIPNLYDAHPDNPRRR